MASPKWIIGASLAVPLILIGVGFCTVYACNEAVCASIVSKCMLTQSCKCELRNCTCCKECFSCLDYLYVECCSCVGLFLSVFFCHCRKHSDVFFFLPQRCARNPITQQAS